jgi:hypothetical protein
MRNADNGFFEPSKRSPVGNKENQAVESYMDRRMTSFRHKKSLLLVISKHIKRNRNLSSIGTKFCHWMEY